MLSRFIGDRYFCGLDIGSQTTKVSLIKYRDDYKPALLGVYESRTHGFKNCSISDLGELSEGIHTAITNLTKKTDVKLKEVQLGIGGELVGKRYSSAVIPLMDRGSKVITTRDVKRLKTQARLLGANMDETILHEFPQFYKVDDINTALNPIGLYGRKLEIKSLLLVVNNNLLRNLTKAVNQGGYDVPHVFLTSFTSAHASLSEPQMQEGCVFVDIGAHKTEMLFFKDHYLQYFESIPWGGEQVSQSISNRLRLTVGLAEDIKKSYATALCSENLSEEEILIKRDEGYRPIKKEVICESIEPIIGRFMTSIHQTLKNSGLRSQMNAGIVISGGGALLSGLPERIEKETEFPVKIGRIHLAVRRIHNSAKFSSAVGLALAGLNKACGRPVQSDERAGWTAHFVNKVKELYQEYF